MVRIQGTNAIHFSSGGEVLSRYDNRRSDEMSPIKGAIYGALDRVFGPFIPATLRDHTLIPSKDSFAADADSFSFSKSKRFEDVDLIDVYVPSNK